MSDTPETDQAWADAWDEGGCYPASIAEVSRRLERQRDAYAETLRIIATANARTHHRAAFTDLISERHPELAENASGETRQQPSATPPTTQSP